MNNVLKKIITIVVAVVSCTVYAVEKKVTAHNAELTVTTYNLLSEADAPLFTFTGVHGYTKTVKVSDLLAYDVVPVRIKISNKGTAPMALCAGAISGVTLIERDQVMQAVSPEPSLIKRSIVGALMSAACGAFGAVCTKKAWAKKYTGSCGVLVGAALAVGSYKMAQRAYAAVTDFLNTHMISQTQVIAPGATLEKWVFVSYSPYVRDMKVTMLVHGADSVSLAVAVDPVEMILFAPVYL